MKEHQSRSGLFGFWSLLACAFVLAAVLRIGLALTLPEGLYWPDSNWYFFVARRIVSGQGFGESLARGPLYPYFLSLILSFSSRIIVVRVCESILSAFACVIMGLLGKRLFSDRVGLLAAFASAVYPYFVYLPSAQVSDNIVTLLLLVSVLFLAGKGISLLWRDAIISGIFLGLSYLARPSIALVLPGMLVWPAFLTKTPGRSRLFSKIVMAAFISLLTVVPWTIHNHVVTGQFVVVSTGGGRLFWYGNSPYATASTVENPAYPPELAEKLARLPDESARETLLYREGLDFIKEYPLTSIGLYLKKLANLFQLFPSVHTASAALQRPAARVATILASALLFALAFFGTILVCIKRSRAVILPLIVASYCLGSAVFLTIMRYRLPVDPYLILLGSAAIGFLLRWPSSLRSPEVN